MFISTLPITGSGVSSLFESILLMAGVVVVVWSTNEVSSVLDPTSTTIKVKKKLV